MAEDLPADRSAHLTANRMAVALREHLDTIGMTQAELARRAGVTPKHINAVLQGRAVGKMAMLDYWAFVLGMEWHVTLEPRS